MLFLFDKFMVDTDRRELLCEGAAISLQPQVFDVLIYLIRNRDRVVTKQDLISAIWGGRSVSESSLTTRINAARAAIGDSGHRQRFIKTLSRKGFRFVGSLSEAAKQSTELLPAASAEARRPSLAVLPFDDLSHDPEMESFCDGLVNTMITALSRFRWLTVASRRSSFALKGHFSDVRKISQELGTRFLLDGSARKSGPRIRISAQLTDGRSGNHVWAAHYDCDHPASLEVQDQITRDVVASLEYFLWFTLARADAHLGPPDPAFSPLKTAAWHIVECTHANNGMAISAATRVAMANPKSVAAYQYLANAYIAQLVLGWSTDFEVDIGNLVEAARRGAALAPADHLCQGLLACAFAFAGYLDQALGCVRRAIDLNRNSVHVLGTCGCALSLRGDAREANEMLERCLSLAPAHYFRAGFLSQMALNWLQLGEPQRGVLLAGEASDLKPEAPCCHIAKAAVLIALNQSHAARAAIATTRKLRPDLNREQMRGTFPHRDRSFPEQLANMLELA